MAFRLVLRQRNVIPVAAGAMAAGAFSMHTTRAYAEEAQLKSRKPIYDDYSPPETSKPTLTIPTARSPSEPASDTIKPTPTEANAPTPTDRVAVYVRAARLQLYELSRGAENSINSAMTHFFHLEHNFTTTIRNLAPPASADEHLLPGTVYVLVAMLGGSILTRNRNILLRASIPATLGVATAYATIPYTMRNVEDLLRTYEERFPEVRKAHVQLNERTRTIWETGKAHTKMAAGKAEESLDDARQGVEDWVKKGR